MAPPPAPVLHRRHDNPGFGRRGSEGGGGGERRGLGRGGGAVLALGGHGWAVLVTAACVAGELSAAPPAPNTPAPAGLVARALDGPLRGTPEIVFCTRLPYDDPHWYANIGYYCDDERKKAYPGNGAPDVGRLLKLNLKTREVTVLFDAQGGSVRDPQVHYDARKILFAHRRAGTDHFHLYEIGVDGAGLRQLTAGAFDDYEPTYLPDGGIAFVSTRCRRWVNCWMTQVGVIYRCDADGGHLQLLSANTEHDNTPWMLPDGRILYTRWEYVDRSQVEFHHLWIMNPDGTGQMVFYGNMHPHILMIDAKPVPGSTDVLAGFSPGHGVNEHAGIATLVTSDGGPDDLRSARALHKGGLVKDPYPLSPGLFLMARHNQILVMDRSGRVEVAHTQPGPGGVHEPRPLRPRARERLIAPRTKPGQSTGRLVLSDVYNGRRLEGVRRGEVTQLLVLESLPKQVNFSGGPDLVSWLGTFTLARVLGTVPVEADGSAYFEVPANRQVFFVALDSRDLSVKRMQSFCSVAPGEVLGCVGCHEPRARAPENKGPSALLALQRAPSSITPFAGMPDVLDFPRDIQPVLDRHCVSCHNYERREGRVALTGDLGPQWSHSYFTLLARLLVADGRNGLGNQPPRTLGSAASPLLRLAGGGHYDVKVSPAEWRTLWLWIESGAPFAGTYAALRNERDQHLAGQATRTVYQRAGAILRQRCAGCHAPGKTGGPHEKPLPFHDELRRKNRRIVGRPTADWERLVIPNDPIARFSTDILINFTRPRHSPLLLGPLARSAGGFESCGAVFKDTADPGYQQLLAALREGRAVFGSQPRYGTAGFKPNAQYVRELKRFGVLPAAFDLAREGLDVFDADQRYWRLFWHEGAEAAGGSRHP
ncbi:MAG: hypothetical protein JXQ71_13440 [Verrucomicrobia bacterium]|nr:hypothetical protein [Verrucomicrobiota bacterium]